MERKERTHKLAVAALLHDIGKVLQRAGIKPQWSDAQEFAVWRNLQSQPAYEHAASTASFITKHLSVLWESQGYDNILNFAGRHHNPSTPLEWVVAEADRLSAGMDREYEGPPPSDASNIPLQPVLARVSLGANVTHAPYFHMIRPLSLDRETLFPSKERGVSREHYLDIYTELVNGARALVQGYLNIKGQDYEYEWVVLAVQSLLERLTWCIPAATTASPCDVSLYDHSRSAAAIAACIAYYDESENNEDFVRDRNDARFALTCVDISGIQTYLHALKSEGARKSLTGRSFYVQLLQDALATEILKRFDLPPVCCIYQGGGKVWLLLPSAVLDDLKKLIDKIDASLWSETGGLLSVSFGASIISGKDFLSSHQGVAFGKRWSEALENLRKNRLRRMATLEYDTIFGIQAAGSYACEQCYGETNDSSGQCEHCRRTQQVGKMLGDVFVFRSGVHAVADPQYSKVNLTQVLGSKTSYSLVPKDSITKSGIYLDTHLVDWQLWLDNTIEGRLLVYWPVAATKSIEFEKLAERNPGVPRLAVLRADVDNLGKIFEQGLSSSEQTISRLSALSRALRDFFCGYIPKSIVSKYHDDIRIVFSGGDDVFIIGAFYKVPEVADFLRSELSDYACKNPCITMSAGIEVQKANAPLLLTARRALEAEQVAKGFRQEKNAVCLFGVPLTWEELKDAGALCNALIMGIADEPAIDFGLSRFACSGVPTVPKNSLPRSLLGVLGGIAALYSVRRGLRRIQTINSHRYRWVTAYSLTRFAEQKPKAQALLSYLKNSLLQESTPPGPVRPLIEFLGVVVDWAYLLTRSF